METSKYMKLNIMGESDDADITKVAENFNKIDEAAELWSNFGNTGTVLETESDFQIANEFPVPDDENAIFAITVKMPRAFAEGDTITVAGIAYNLYQGTDPALSEAWKAGEVVTINFDKTSRRCWASAGGGAPRPLPAQVSNMQASTPDGETPSIVFTWTNPVDENFAGMILVVKEGSAPNGVTDGTQVYKGTGTTFTYTEGVQWDHTYFGRGFAYNSQNKYQMDATGAIASATPSDIPPAVYNFSIQENEDEATLAWKNPQSSKFKKTIIVQKIGDASTNITDGVKIYEGIDETFTATGLQNHISYFWTAFALNSDNEYDNANSPTVSYTPNYFPVKPGSESDYTLIETITSSKTWIVPEDGWYMVDVVSASGAGGSAWYQTYASTCACASGGGGGSGAYARSILSFNKGQSIPVTVGGIASFGSYLSATAGSSGDDASSTASSVRGGSGGTAYGGTEANVQGNQGNPGTKVSGSMEAELSSGGGSGGSAGGLYPQRGGNGEQVGWTDTYDPGSGNVGPDRIVWRTVSTKGRGSNAFVKIFRGNTNVVG